MMSNIANNFDILQQIYRGINKATSKSKILLNSLYLTSYLICESKNFNNLATSM